jgi:tRNA(Ile2) C34 agmatinyltransferase TiaS
MVKKPEKNVDRMRAAWAFSGSELPDPACRECGADMEVYRVEFGVEIGAAFFRCEECGAEFNFTEDEKGIVSTQWSRAEGREYAKQSNGE